MKLDEKQQNLLRTLPGVDYILEIAKSDSFFNDIPKSVQVRSVRTVIESFRAKILKNDQHITEASLSDIQVIESLKKQVTEAITPNLKPVVNATGVVVHTNLGRSLLAKEAIENISSIASQYSNLEFDLAMGERGLRYHCVEELLCEITGAEAGMVVNNNAGAVLLCLETLAKGKKVVISRGELVEIGGSFRIPDVMARSGAILKEVGTTNRTHLKDYENAIEDDTGLLLKVHKSNYSIVGFSKEIPIKELVDLGATYHLPVMEDLGSGTFIDFSKYDMIKEPTVQDSVASGADLVTFSGDKMLGGPQAGIIVGKKEFVENVRQNPLTRALRIDKLTLAALESTLRLYREPDKAVHAIPTLRMLTCAFYEIEKKAEQLANMLRSLNNSRISIELLNISSRVGGGALPLQNLPSKGVGVKINGITVNAIEKYMRENDPPIIGRIEEDFFIMDLRTVADKELPIIEMAFDRVLKRVLI